MTPEEAVNWLRNELTVDRPLRAEAGELANAESAAVLIESLSSKLLSAEEERERLRTALIEKERECDDLKVDYEYTCGLLAGERSRLDQAAKLGRHWVELAQGMGGDHESAAFDQCGRELLGIAVERRDEIVWPTIEARELTKDEQDQLHAALRKSVKLSE
jgi:hypothetical protein